MGSVFGKQTVAEPPFESILNRTTTNTNTNNNVVVQTSYEIRKYGQRFAAECAYHSGDNPDDMSSPFKALAAYIGVFGPPENEGSQSISMTAPVVIEKKQGAAAGTPIAMTAPVVVVTENDDISDDEKIMRFILPATYTELSEIPIPTNPAVHIQVIPPSVGAVHRYAGSMSDDRNRAMAVGLADQLLMDGVLNVTEEGMLQHYQFWGYNPPFTLPMFRRNEVWIELTQSQVDHLLHEFTTTTGTTSTTSNYN